MTEQDQRIAIATACKVQTEGWWCPKCEQEVASAFVTFDETHDPPGEVCGFRVESMPIPDYLHDLNAVHDAEETLTESEQVAFCVCLRGIAHGKPNHIQMFYAYHATAAQRAEAFLKTKGLWK